MNSGKPAFTFTPHEAALLMADIGRTDVSAVSFVADAEACLQAFEYVARGEMSLGMPQEIGDHLATIVRTATELRSALNQLPDDVSMLLDLHLLSDGARRRIALDFSQIVEPLEDMVDGIAELRRTTAGDAAHNNLRLENHLVRAIATAFRNRLNRKASADEESGFPNTLAHILESAGHRLPGVAASAAALTPTRLRDLLGSTKNKSTLTV
jgi:metal-dependent amidase/aminoacylase/carboxypeptidase family protein